MIQSKRDLKYYLEEDRKAYDKPKRLGLKGLLFPDYNYKFVKALRRYEYQFNKGHKIRAYFYGRKYSKLGMKIGVSLPPNVVGPGCHITHGKFIANGEAKIGAKCKIYDGVTVGGTGRYDIVAAPIIGDRVVLCTGAKVIGNVRIADDIVVGANAVVTKDILESGITVGGIPARKISDNGSGAYLNRLNINMGNEMGTNVQFCKEINKMGGVSK